MSEITRFEGRWLRFNERTITRKEGNTSAWEYVTRKGTTGAVCIFAVRETTPPQVVAVRQVRPAVGETVVELPAGLIDPGEDPAEAARRELAEETGFLGRVTEVGPPVVTSPGLTDETVIWVRLEIQGMASAQPDADECIETVLFPLNDLRNALLAEAAKGNVIDAKLWYLAEGLAMADEPWW